MTVVDEDTLRDMELARRVIGSEDVSVVVVQYEKVWRQKKGSGLKPFLEVIEELGDDISGCVIGDRILGRASALLCRYIKAGAVYSPCGTKTGIALLIMGGVPCQVDRMIPFIKNRDGDMCPFEKLLGGVEDPAEAYNVLRDRVLKE